MRTRAEICSIKYERMSFKSEIKKLVDKSTAGPAAKHLIVSLGKLTKAEAAKIKVKTGKEVTGFERIIDNYAVKHTLKVHGNIAKEKLRGQIAIEPDDFKLIPEIVKTENIIYAGKNHIGRDVILYEKKIGLLYFYAEEIRNSKKQLALNSLWKRKAKK